MKQTILAFALVFLSGCAGHQWERTIEWEDGSHWHTKSAGDTALFTRGATHFEVVKCKTANESPENCGAPMSKTIGNESIAGTLSGPASAAILRDSFGGDETNVNQSQSQNQGQMQNQNQGGMGGGMPPGRD